jgi:uncharacterized protein YndB with AHSA1/START domain
MPTRRAAIELLAPPPDVWAFLAEPRHLADWWPNLASVEPDRRGVSTGARWRVRARGSTLFRRAEAEDILLVQAAETERRLGFELVRARLRVELVLEAAAGRRTHAELVVTGPFLAGFSRTLPRDALQRLHALVQTAAEL